MVRNEYPHFNPSNYDIDVKIAVVESRNHAKFNLNYHIVWIPKYRRKVLKNKVKEVLRSIIEGQCEDLGLKMLALEIMPDHIHLFVGATPTHKPCDIVKQIKGNSSIQLRRCFKHLPYLLWNFGKRFPNLWAKGYYIGSAGHVSQDAVKRYILEQEGKDVFEYSIFGNPDVKISKFSQEKLDRWS